MIYAICLLLIATGFVMAALTDYTIKNYDTKPKEYIDKYYASEPISIMMTNIDATYLEILTYCNEQGYEPSKRRLRREPSSFKIGFFDVDNYKPETI